MHHTVEGLPVLQDNLGRAAPVSVRVPLEINPVPGLDPADISVDPLPQRLPDCFVGFTCGECLTGGHLDPVVPGPLGLGVRQHLVLARVLLD